MPGFDVVNNLNVAQQLFGLLFAVTYGAMLMASRRYGLFNTYKAVLKMRGPNSKRAVLGFVFLNILPVLHFALLMFWFGRIYLRSDLAMVLGLLIIGLQPVAVFGYHRMLLGSLYCCPNTFFDDGLTELGKIEEEGGRYPDDKAWPHVVAGVVYIFVPFDLLALSCCLGLMLRI